MHDANEIRDACDRWRQHQWPAFQKERALTNFYNGDSLPVEDCEDPPATLGIGQRFVKEPFKQLMAPWHDESGPVDAVMVNPLDPMRGPKLGRALDDVMNELIISRYRSMARKIAGQYLITGRAFAYRISKWDWIFKHGRILAPAGTGDDLDSDDFWEWSFMGRLELRQLRAILDSPRTSRRGWDREAVQKLVDWIEGAGPDREHELNGANTTPVSPANSPGEFSARKRGDSPLDVYFYFRKNPKKKNGRFRKVDFSIVSRFNEDVSFPTKNIGGGVVQQKLAIEHKKDKKRPGAENASVLFSMDEAFDSIHECLIGFVGDARVAGDQELHQVRGEGEQVMGRQLAVEHLARAVLEGVAWSVQPNFSMEGNSEQDRKHAERISAEGLVPWQFAPPRLKMMDKSQGLSGANAAMQMLSALGISSEQDVATGYAPNGNGFGRGGGGPEFKSEADQMMAVINDSVSQRLSTYYAYWDCLWNQVGDTLSRRLTRWRKSDAGYADAAWVQATMAERHGFLPMEYIEGRIKLVARRVAGGADRQTAIGKAASLLSSDATPPEAKRWAAKQQMAALYSDRVAEEVYPDEPEPVDQNQMRSALDQNNAALSSLLALQPDPGDEPFLHLTQFHQPALEGRIQLLFQQGYMTPIEAAGVQKLMEHMALDAMRLPDQQLVQQWIQQLQQVGAALQQLPVSAKGSQLDFEQRKADREDMKAQATVAERQSLIENRAQGMQMKARDGQFRKNMEVARQVEAESENDRKAREKLSDQQLELLELTASNEQ